MINLEESLITTTSEKPLENRKPTSTKSPSRTEGPSTTTEGVFTSTQSNLIITTTQPPGKNKTFTNDKLKCIFHEKVYENGEKIDPKELELEESSCVQECVCENSVS